MPMTISGTGNITGLSVGGLPSAVITQPVLAQGIGGTGPAFSAYQSTAQPFTINTPVKIQFQTKEFDTSTSFDNTTNYRFTPTVAGYYQISSGFTYTTGSQANNLSIYKNGSQNKALASNSSAQGAFGSALVYLNGSTDYIEIFATIGSTQSSLTGASYTYFQAFLARSA